MKSTVFIILFFFIISCDKSFEPIGGEVYLQSNKSEYANSEKVEIFLINESNLPVYGIEQIGRRLYKKHGEKWLLIDRGELSGACPQSYKIDGKKNLVYSTVLADTGYYKFKMLLSWDKERKEFEGLGEINSNVFSVNIGT